MERLLRRAGSGEWPWLVINPDGTKAEVYNTMSQMWEENPNMSGHKLKKRSAWDEQLARVVQETSERARWKRDPCRRVLQVYPKRHRRTGGKIR